MNIQPTFTFTNSTQKKIIGKSLWKNYIHHITSYINTTNVKKRRYKICNFFTKSSNWIISYSDFDLLKTCFLTNTNVNLFDDPWKTTTFIVPRNELRNAINQQMININSIKSKQKVIL
jgi:hypothetical protein